jgi:hypothetical protein
LRARPKAVFGNSIGDRRMLEYQRPATVPRPVLHDDADCESQNIYPFRDKHVGFVLGAILVAAVSRLTQTLCRGRVIMFFDFASSAVSHP